ncbi:pseudouridine synthase [Streptobacillus ratti]|uniref:pseudouridine synthase n=1 Tax=Streptobacillus ratti TaxID=1720557 RepID=UPI000934455B|nr:pseudouridine synthase [Streptobacillus ratti]
MRLDKFLANSGIGTRKEVKEIIKTRKIFVNDKIVVSPDVQINEIKDVIKYENNIIRYTKFRYIMLNKPKGYISATDDSKQKTVLDLITDFKTYKLFPVGRLDIDTEGLLLLTNDGDLAHNLLSPRKHVEKKYYVELNSPISFDDIQNIESGIDIGEGIVTKASKIIKIDDYKLYIIITEGKFHQVKRMFKAVHNEVKYLKRISMGSLTLDENLNLGEYRELTDEELRNLL